MVSRSHPVHKPSLPACHLWRKATRGFLTVDRAVSPSSVLARYGTTARSKVEDCMSISHIHYCKPEASRKAVSIRALKPPLTGSTDTPSGRLLVNIIHKGVDCNLSKRLSISSLSSHSSVAMSARLEPHTVVKAASFIVEKKPELKTRRALSRKRPVRLSL